MRLFISVLLAGLMLSCAMLPAKAQSSYTVVATCGTPPVTFAAGAVRTGTMDTSGRICSVASVTGGGDATAANQVLQITQETAVNTLLGLQADAACATDNGTCTLAALVKRLNQRLTTINTTLGSPIQATGGTVAVTAASGSFVSGSQSIGITPTDRTVTSATGASQTVMAANASRKQLTIVNTGNANCGINPTGGTAAIGGAGTITLAPLGSYTPRVPTLAAVTAICTAAQPLYADES